MSAPRALSPARGAVLVTGASWLARLASLATVAVLARLLDAADFGVVAFAASIVLGTELLVRGGFAHAIVQRDDLDTQHADAAFWLSLGMAGVLFAVVLVTSPLVTAGLDDPVATRVLRIMGLRLFLAALGEVPRALLLRARAYDAIAVRSVAGATTGLVAALAAGFAGLGVWALVLQVLVQAGVETATLWAAAHWRPRAALSRAHAGDVVRFGAGVVGMQASDLVARRSDVVVVGAVLGAAVAGVYAIGQRLVLLGVDLVVRAPMQVLLPTLARRQHDADRLRAGFLDAVRLSAAVVVPVFGLLAARSADVVAVVFGPDWSEAAPVLAALSAYGIVAGLAIVANNVVLATGASDVAARLAAMEALASLVALLLAVQHGPGATAVAFTIASLLVLPWRLSAACRPVGLVLPDVARAAWPGLLAGSLAVLAGHATVGLLGATPLVRLVAAVVVTVALHVALLRAVAGSTLERVVELVRSARSERPGRPVS